MGEQPDQEGIHHVQMLTDTWLPGKDFQCLLSTDTTHINSLNAFGKCSCPCLMGWATIVTVTARQEPRESLLPAMRSVRDRESQKWASISPFGHQNLLSLCTVCPRTEGNLLSSE